MEKETKFAIAGAIILFILSSLLLLKLEFDDNLTTGLPVLNNKEIKQAEPNTGMNKILPQKKDFKFDSYKKQDICNKEFSPTQTLINYRNSLLTNNIEMSLSYLNDWNKGLICMTNYQLTTLDRQHSIYLKSLSNKDVALLLNPTINLIELAPWDNEMPESFKEFEKRFQKPKDFSEMKNSYPHEIGFFFTHYDTLEMERFISICANKNTRTIECSPTFDKLKEYFNKKNLGRGECDIVDTIEKEFLCDQGVICGNEPFINKQNKLKGQAWPAMTETTFNINSLGDYGLGLSTIDSNQLLRTGEKAGATANHICNELNEINKKKNEGKDVIGDISDVLNLEDDDCEMFDARDINTYNIGSQAKTGNLGYNPECYESSPETQGSDKFASIRKKHSKDICLNSDTDIVVIGPSGSFTKDFTKKEKEALKIGEEVCKGRYCISQKDGVTNVRRNPDYGSQDPNDNEPSISREYREDQDDSTNNLAGRGAERCQGRSCIYDDKGNKIFDSKNDGNKYEWEEDGERFCIGDCEEGPEDDDAGFVVKLDKDGKVTAIECIAGTHCIGGDKPVQDTPTSPENPEEPPSESPEERNPEGGEETVCSPSTQRGLDRLMCITSGLGLNSDKEFIFNNNKETRISGQLIQPPNTPDSITSNKCSDLIINKKVRNINKALCDKVKKYGRPDDTSSCRAILRENIDMLKSSINNAPKPIDPPKM
ncbi:hypothetical protein J4476_04370 [Candidatus Woesearchaeota archaeon]|nr:MAG: hypothetical protein QT09_C0002G0024 [archaeon GW2011_AR18]MBS3161899.1 hypothetical protein [Candidatus Woesearchaeota archaeon]HIH26103.1 hypothetical protein [Nanoarchaeota archaeon]